MLVLAVLLIASVIGGLPVYVRPHVDQLRRADAILVLGGPGDDRYQFGLELGRQGWAPATFWSNPAGSGGLTKYCEKYGEDYNLHCFVPDPPTTKGEARALRDLATQYGWRTVIVVTFRPHISRARFILKQCFDGDLVMVGSPTNISKPQWAFQYVYQTVGYIRAALQPDC